MATAGVQRSDSVAITWRQRGITWHPAEIYNLSPERGDQIWGTTTRPKSVTMTGHKAKVPANVPSIDKVIVCNGKSAV